MTLMIAWYFQSSKEYANEATVSSISTQKKHGITNKKPAWLLVRKRQKVLTFFMPMCK